jgi:hypothetical protein
MVLMGEVGNGIMSLGNSSNTQNSSQFPGDGAILPNFQGSETALVCRDFFSASLTHKPKTCAEKRMISARPAEAQQHAKQV